MLRAISSFLFGLVVVGLVWLVTNILYPYPAIPDEGGHDHTKHLAAASAWGLNASMMLVVVATVILLVSVALASKRATVENGLLLGGMLTMACAVLVSVFTDLSVSRFMVIGVALVVAVSIGWLKLTCTRGVRKREGVVNGAAERRLARTIS